MQKVIQRTATARKQAQKKIYRAKKQDALVERKDAIRQRKEFNKSIVGNLKAARQARWEDWSKGPLAPKRDAGLKATTYGTMDGQTMHPPNVPPHRRRKEILFTPGDRVCIVRGRDAGKINEVIQINEESETVLIKDLNMVRLETCVQSDCSSPKQSH
jgi:large subunit ribosomal protein L24